MRTRFFLLLVRLVVFFLMIRLPPRSTRTDTLFPYTTLFRSAAIFADEMFGHQPPGIIGGAINDDVEFACFSGHGVTPVLPERSEEHTSELQSLMRISYAVFCLKKKKKQYKPKYNKIHHTNHVMIIK